MGRRQSAEVQRRGDGVLLGRERGERGDEAVDLLCELIAFEVRFACVIGGRVCGGVCRRGTLGIAMCWQAGQATEYGVVVRQVAILRRLYCDVSVGGVVLLKETEKSVNFALTNTEILVGGGCLTVCFSDDEHVQFFGEVR